MSMGIGMYRRRRGLEQLLHQRAHLAGGHRAPEPRHPQRALAARGGDLAVAPANDEPEQAQVLTARTRIGGGRVEVNESIERRLDDPRAGNWIRREIAQKYKAGTH